ncbi:5-formyltetrahydrofolate cyclo-ligase [Knoellia remsis]|uniref:5-formyltetrahydrofolate cyclo-ligase n=2 Tax=Knoellia remsis TaxID=407159 RepID=A0A2T0U6F1_9MICO|nr:5-formyltetrahydrofolate cyclo-ligase [Knoellia remsis]
MGETGAMQERDVEARELDHARAAPRAVHDAKAAARPGLLAARRATVAGRDRAADAAAIASYAVRLAAATGVPRGGTVAAYEALPSEPPTEATLAALAAGGIRVIVPVTLPDRDLDWCDPADPARTPLGRDAIAAARLVLVPALAADTGGTRLGRGGGSYDRALTRRHRDARVLAVLHPGELRTDPLPCGDHDEPVDGVLTAEGVTWVSRARA